MLISDRRVLFEWASFVVSHSPIPRFKMKPWQRPQLFVYGNAAELTKSKVASGTDAFAGGQPEPGGIGIDPFRFADSQDGVVIPRID